MRAVACTDSSAPRRATEPSERPAVNDAPKSPSKRSTRGQSLRVVAIAASTTRNIQAPDSPLAAGTDRCIWRIWSGTAVACIRMLPRRVRSFRSQRCRAAATVYRTSWRLPLLPADSHISRFGVSREMRDQPAAFKVSVFAPSPRRRRRSRGPAWLGPEPRGRPRQKCSSGVTSEAVNRARAKLCAGSLARGLRM